MRFRKCFVFLLALLLLLPVLPLPTFAAGDPTLKYEVLIDGAEVKEAEAGDIITVTLYLQRTDKNEAYTMYAMQSELRYDSAFFELVADSVHLYTGVQSNDIAVGGGLREFYMNFVSLSGGVQWQPRTKVGSFQLRVIAPSGVSRITNEDFLVSKKDGSGGYACQSNVATVVVSTECTVKIQTNGGNEMPPITVVYGEKLTRPADPVREGKVFAGWYKDVNLTEEWNFEVDIVQGNFSLYAKWVDAPPQPTDPTQPQPTDPTDPKPTDPKPTDPTGSQPTEPSQTVTQPGQTQPTEPTEPTEPAEKENCFVCEHRTARILGLCLPCLMQFAILLGAIGYMIYRKAKKKDRKKPASDQEPQE